ncbi:hypothetical protein NAPIS_ORF02633 [Vairimorpha apis BRL 01]|uniref:Uncharacterized protein n=1 Tax=Vairimorpha apis BRL 01 TaxID=1037528 RepID=T0MFE9_9MICR|nr:hypothetical protein NAPIS_ORF02633 [Vairimorpha apis BRL 01]
MFLLFINTVLTINLVLFQHAHSDYYICDSEPYREGSRHCIACHEHPSHFELINTGDGNLFIKSPINNSVFDVAKYKRDLIMVHENGGDNQLYQIRYVNPIHAVIVNSYGKCVTFVPSTNTYELVGCMSNAYQLYKVVSDVGHDRHDFIPAIHDSYPQHNEDLINDSIV